MKRAWWAIMLLGWLPDATAQSHGGMEQYCSLQPGNSFLPTPVVYFESSKKWYLEGRYNYEAFQTLSVYVGKTFKYEGSFSLSVSPIAGVVTGKYNGGSAGANIEFEANRLFLSSQSQYTFSLEDKRENFIYSWTNAGCKIVPCLSAGLSLQQTKIYRVCGSLVGGMFVQAAFKNWSLPVYMFNSNTKDRYWVLGLNYEWQYKKTANEKEL